MLDRGIAMEPSTIDQHEQNGAAELTNRIIMDRLHHMLIEADIDIKWWPEIPKSITYLRNRTPSTVTGKTPYKAW
jgi:hypothetical protein